MQAADDHASRHHSFKERELGLGSRLLIGGIAGFVGTMAMTGAMRRLHARLPPEERYPLTPREIIDSVAEQQGMDLGDEVAKDATIAGHFLYGAACGAALGVINPQMGRMSGALAGAGVWLASYMGWIPAAGILKPASEHPPRRNALMIGVHLVWGASTAAAMRELLAVRRTMIEAGPDRDAPDLDGPGDPGSSPGDNPNQTHLGSAAEPLSPRAD